MTPFAQSILANARREATATQQQPDALLAEWLAAVLLDTAGVIDGVCPGFLRRPPRHEVREPKVQRPVVDVIAAPMQQRPATSAAGVDEVGV